MPKPGERPLVIAGQRHRFERLTHFPGQQQPAGLTCPACLLLDISRAGRGEPLDAHSEEKGCRGTESSHFQPRSDRSFRCASKVDPRGDVLYSDVDIRGIVSTMFEMAAQSSAHALRVIVVGAR